MKRNLQVYTFAQNSVVSTATGASESLNTWHSQEKPGGFAIVSNITVDTNAAKTFTSGNVGTNQITFTAHGWKTGIVGQLTTTGNLPTGLSLLTNYYVGVIDANTVALYDTAAHAIAGGVTGKLTYTATGDSGTGTFTPTALAAASVQPQFSRAA